MTLEELAALVYELPENGGKSRSPGHIGYIERGDRELSYEWARLLSKALGVRVEYLLGEDNYKTERAHRMAKEVEPCLADANIRRAANAYLECFSITFDPPICKCSFIGNPRKDEIFDKVIKDMGITPSSPICAYTTDEFFEKHLKEKGCSGSDDGEWLNELDADARYEFAEFLSRITQEEYAAREEYTVIRNGVNAAVVSASVVENLIDEMSDYALTAIRRFFRDNDINW